MRIGILGGSFNPLHRGHLHIAQEVCQQEDLQKVLFIPTFCPPHKQNKRLLPAAFRLHLLQKALENRPLFEVSDVEIRRGGISYTVDTLAELQRTMPEAELFFIIGSDMVAGLPQWKEIGRILELCQFLIVNRPDHPIDWEKLRKAFSERELSRLKSLTVPPLAVSSSEVRRRLLEGRSVRDLVPDEIVELLENQFLEQWEASSSSSSSHH